MKEESNCFGLIIWIRAARGYTHLSRALPGCRDGEEGGRGRRGEGGGAEKELVSRKYSPTSIFQIMFVLGFLSLMRFDECFHTWEPSITSARFQRCQMSSSPI